jgi:hypothetical protein
MGIGKFIVIKVDEEYKNVTGVTHMTLLTLVTP